MVRNLRFVLLLALLPVLGACEAGGGLRIGHEGGFLSAPLYAAQDGLNLSVRQFGSSSAIATALAAGALDAGFVDAESLPALAMQDGFPNRFAVAGVITYPFGATLVLREGLNVRLHELDGLTIAAADPRCKLLSTFREDAARLGADISSATFEYLPFHAMLPALAAGAVDGAIIRGAYSAAALQGGNQILYQNWDMEAGDACCPAIVDQTARVLLARRDNLEAAESFIEALLATNTLPPYQLRQAVADNTGIPLAILQGQPVPTFSLADDSIVNAFIHRHGKGLGNGRLGRLQK